jgi:hypothetical protein
MLQHMSRRNGYVNLKGANEMFLVASYMVDEWRERD